MDVVFTGDCPARRSGLERSFFCLENNNRVWYAQEMISLVVGGLMGLMELDKNATGRFLP